MKTSICIVDDEIRARERIRKLLGNRPDSVVAGEADNGRDAVSLIDRVRPDLVILDIRMPGLSGFQILQEASFRPAVIFVTAYDEHAVQAFEVHAVDYLLKPFQDLRFHQALDRVPDVSSLNSRTLNELRTMIEGSSTRKRIQRRISVKDKFEYRIINITDIDYFTTEGGLVFLHTDGIRYVVDQTLSQLEDSLPSEKFFRAHRKSLVNIDRIEKVVPWGRGRHVLKYPYNGKVHLSKEKTRQFKMLIGLT